MGGSTVKFVEKPRKWEYDIEDPFSDEGYGVGVGNHWTKKRNGEEDSSEDVSDEGFAEAVDVKKTKTVLVKRKDSKRRLALRNPSAATPTTSTAATAAAKKKGGANEVYWGKGRGVHDDADDLDYDDFIPFTRSQSHLPQRSNSAPAGSSKRNVRKSQSEGVLRRLASGKPSSTGRDGKGSGREAEEPGKGSERGKGEASRPMISGPFPLAKASSVKNLREAVRQERRGTLRPPPPIPEKKEKKSMPRGPPPLPMPTHRSRSRGSEKKVGVGGTGATVAALKEKLVATSAGEPQTEREEHKKVKKASGRLKHIWPWAGTHATTGSS